MKRVAAAALLLFHKLPDGVSPSSFLTMVCDSSKLIRWMGSSSSCGKFTIWAVIESGSSINIISHYRCPPRPYYSPRDEKQRDHSRPLSAFVREKKRGAPGMWVKVFRNWLWSTRQHWWLAVNGVGDKNLGVFSEYKLGEFVESRFVDERLN